MIKKAWNFQRYSLLNILLRVKESFAHSLIFGPKSLSLIIDDFYYWFLLGDIITLVHLCVTNVTSLHRIYQIICYQLQRNLYQVLSIIIISTCQNCVVYYPKGFSFICFILAYDIGQEKIIYDYHRNNKNESNFPSL